MTSYLNPQSKEHCGQRAHEAGTIECCCSLKDETHDRGTQEQGAWVTGRGTRKEENEWGQREGERVDSLV